MKYLEEFRVYWQFLAAGSLGLAAGYSLVNYLYNLFTPYLLDEFSWSKSDVALVGSAAFLGVLTQPLMGRLVDRYGVKRIASIGVVSAPMIFVGLGSMSGALWQYAVLIVLQVIVIGGTTSAVIYSRLVAQSFQRARGVAFAITASAAPVAGAVMVPFLALLMEQASWREGYYAVALFTAVAGGMALAFIPSDADGRRAPDQMRAASGTRYGEIFRSRSFQLIVAGFVLSNFAFTLQTQHLKVVLLDNGVDSTVGSIAISLFALSVISGRMIFGVALDRFPAYLVTAIAFALPGVGLAILAAGASASSSIFIATMVLGVALGAESDVLAYVVGRYFPLEIFSTVLGLLLGALAFSIATGSLLLSYLLQLTGSYVFFLVFSSAACFVGSGFLLLLKREPVAG